MTTLPPRLVVLAVLALCVSGCALLRQLLSQAFQEPTFKFEAVTLSDVTLEGATFDLVYSVDNPNPVALDLAEVEYALEIEGRPVVSGRPAQGLRIPAEGRTQLRFPAKITFADLFATVAALAGKETAQYAARGAIALGSPVGPLRFPLQTEGRFEVPRAPELAIGAPRITELSLSSATIELPLEIKNRSPFPLNLGLAGALALGGAKVASVAEGTVLAAAPRETTTVRVPLRLHFADAIGVARAGASGAAPLTFEGALSSGRVQLPLNVTQLLAFPKLSFASASLSEVDFRGGKLNLVFDAENPTDLTLPLAGVQYALFVDGKKTAAAPSGTPPSLAPRSKSQVTFPLPFSFAELGASLATLFTGRSSSYRAEGAFTLPSPLGPVRVPVATEGRFELPRLPRLTIQPPRITSMTFTRATLELPVEISNPNTFPVAVDALEAAVSIAGARVGDVSFAELGSLAPGETRTVAAPVSFELLQFVSAATALRTGNATVALDGSLRSGELTLPLRAAQTVRFAR